MEVLLPDDSTCTLDLTRGDHAVGRNPEASLLFDSEAYPQVSWEHCDFGIRDGAPVVIHRSQSNPTLCNDRSVQTRRVRSGDIIQLGQTGPTIKIVAIRRQRKSSAPHRSSPVYGAGPSLRVVDQAILGRSEECGRFAFDHPQVSRRHAKLTIKSGQVFIEDLDSANGTFINGTRILGSARLAPEDTVELGPFSLRFDGTGLVASSRANNVELACSGVGKIVSDVQTGRPLTLLRDIRFSIPGQQFVCILGPSGSGKSTLLNILSGRSQPTDGEVTVNGRNLHRAFDALREDIVIVPQKTLLHTSLTVMESLSFTAALRLPPDTSRDEIQTAIQRTLSTVGIEDRAGVRVENLSGGQLKRVGLGAEILSDPGILFLDEVTSGLDEKSDGEMMSLFRKLADSGKTVVCITHNLGHIEQFCDSLVILTRGGRLAFVGAPADALEYFGCRKLPEIYDVLSTATAESWEHRFVRHAGLDGHEHSHCNRSDEEAEKGGRYPEIGRAASQLIRQSFILLRRNIRIWRSDVRALAALLGQAILVAVLISAVFGAVEGPVDISSQDPAVQASQQVDEYKRLTRINNLLFVIVVSTFWLGCNNSAKEIVKERRIYEKERDFNLQPESFLISKFGTMCCIGMIQVALLGTVSFVSTDLPGDWTPQFWNLGLLMIAGTSLGLAISANAQSEEVAVALVPVAVIPQIILAGVVADLSRIGELFSRAVISVYWGVKSAVNLPDNFRPESDFTPSVTVCSGVVGLHIALYLTAAVYGVRRRTLR